MPAWMVLHVIHAVQIYAAVVVVIVLVPAWLNAATVPANSAAKKL